MAGQKALGYQIERIPAAGPCEEEGVWAQPWNAGRILIGRDQGMEGGKGH